MAYSLHVLRRKRRQAEIGTAAALTKVVLQVESASVSLGVLEVILQTNTANLAVGENQPAPVIAAVKAVGTVAGLPNQVADAETLEQLADTGSGVRLRLTFSLDVNLSAPWALYFPTQWAAVGSILGSGIEGVRDAISLAEIGNGNYVALWTNTDAAPEQMWALTATNNGTSNDVILTLSGAPSPVTIVGLPAFTASTAFGAVSVSDIGGGQLVLTFGSGFLIGQTLSFPANQHSVLSPSGAALVPFQMLIAS